MPRLNRDLERRLAARRERERRRPRPTEPRYRFTAPAEAAEEGEEHRLSGVAEAEAPLAEAGAAPRPPRTIRAASTRAAPRPFTAYRDEYRYVLRDLRRIVIVVAVLLILLGILWVLLRF